MSFTVKTDRALVGNKYQVQISITEVTPADQDLIKANGEPLVPVGGLVTGPSDTVTLPSKDARLTSGFPIVQIFDGSAFIDPAGLASAWATDVLAAITAAIGALRASPDAFTGSESVTI